jgi:hypothetical protein
MSGASSPAQLSDAVSLRRFRGPMPSSIFPSTGSMRRRPLPSSGSLGSGSPAHRYYEALRPPAIHPGGLVALARRYRPRACLLRSRVGQHSLRRARVLVTRLPYRLSRTEMTGSPRFLGRPLCMPCSHQTPAGPSRQAIRRSRCCLPLLTRRRLPRSRFRGSITRPASLAVYASQRRLPEPRKTRFRLVATLGRAGFDPQDQFGKFPSDSSHVISSPFPELCSAHARFAHLDIQQRAIQGSHMYEPGTLPVTPSLRRRRRLARTCTRWCHAADGRRARRWNGLSKSRDPSDIAGRVHGSNFVRREQSCVPGIPSVGLVNRTGSGGKGHWFEG